MDPSSSIPRPSGLPRPTASRLPVLRSAGSQSQLRTPSSTEQLRKKPSLSTLSRPAQPTTTTTTLQKKASRTSLARSSTPSTATTTANRRVSGIPSIGPPRTAPAPKEAPVFKRPFARPPSRQAKVPQTPAASTGKEDALGSLDGFRSSSRASSRAGSRLGSREDDAEQDFAISNEPEHGTPRKSRPSLSERTIESLSQLPSSPAGSKTRRRSSFFNADNSMPPPLRPASAMSNNSRPGTSDGPTHIHPATPKRFGAPSGRLSMTAPGKRSVSANVSTPLGTPSRPIALSRPNPVSTVKAQPLSLVHNVQSTPKPRPLSSSKSMVARTPKSRPSLGGVFGKAISPPGTAFTSSDSPSPSRDGAVKKTPTTALKISKSSALREHIAKAKAARTSDVEAGAIESPSRPANSSNALREHIAKAKAAARQQAKAEPLRTSTPPRDAILPDPAEIATFDFGLDQDPFNQRGKSSKSLLRKRIDGARMDGRLNLAAMGLKEVPDDVLTMYKYDPDDTTISWGEVVDLTAFIAPDNELETLPDTMFPDVDFEEISDPDEGGPQFGGLQNVDLHGNVLRGLPVGLGRLTQLSKLNLSRNKLPMEILDIIANIPTLRELKLAENNLRGDLSSVLLRLTALEILDLQNNQIESIPAAFGQLAALKILNVAENQLRVVPMELFSSKLMEFHASKNRLEGTFFSVHSVPHLQELHLANNSLLSVCDSHIDMPALRILNLTTNRMTSLPDVSALQSLTTLLVSENKLKAIPEGFSTLSVRSADFTGNDITQLDPRIALMETLEHFTIAANPLRERKFLTMSVDDLKRDLSSRIEPETTPEGQQDGEGDEQGATPETRSTTGWELTPSGTLDLSGRSLAELDDSAMIDFAETHQVRQIYLQRNSLDCIPIILSQLTHLTVIDLSKNNIESALEFPLEFLKLRELRLNNNRLRSLESLTSNLNAPSLQTLDVSQNRLSGSLPTLHSTFPALTTILASDNSISEVSAESLAGLKVVNLSNNDIDRLEPQIGLLQGTLTALEVAGNRFRVPNYQVLGKGTDAVLTWLRDKIPRESWKSDGTEVEFFDAVDGTTF